MLYEIFLHFFNKLFDNIRKPTPNYTKLDQIYTGWEFGVNCGVAWDRLIYFRFSPSTVALVSCSLVWFEDGFRTLSNIANFCYEYIKHQGALPPDRFAAQSPWVVALRTAGAAYCQHLVPLVPELWSSIACLEMNLVHQIFLILNF